MKRTILKVIALVLALSVCVGTIQLTAIRAHAASGTTFPLKFSKSYNVIKQYVTKDQSKIILLDGNTLYEYSISDGSLKTLTEFPVAKWQSGENRQHGQYYGEQELTSAYVDENKGLLYYMYNSYTNTFSEDETVNIICYDMESEKEKYTAQINGHIGYAVGASPSGTIFLSTSEYFEEDGKAARLLVLDGTSHKILKEETVSNTICEFTGFCNDGTVYYLDEYMYVYYGYDNLLGRLMKGKYTSSSFTPGSNEITVVKNIYFGDYNTPVELIDNKYLATFKGKLIPLSSITDNDYDSAVSALCKIEQNEDHAYTKNAGANTVIIDDEMFYLQSGNCISGYNIPTAEKNLSYSSSDYIFSIKKCGDNLIALCNGDNGYYYKTIAKSMFTPQSTSTNNMNNFKVYKNRSKRTITNSYIKSIPYNFSSKLYTYKGSISPYKESRLTDSTKGIALKYSNYIRWLGGLTTFSSAPDSCWSKTAKGAVLLSSDFDHTASKPSDMPQDFYEDAYEATSNSSISSNGYANQGKIIWTVRQFMNDNGYSVPGHRNNFMTRNATTIAYGFYDRYTAQMVNYTGNPNPQGTAHYNNEAAYSWPAPGYFPAEEISPSSVWSICLNTDKINYSDKDPKITITDLNTGKKYTRTDGNGLYSTNFWGTYLSFKPPVCNSSSYNGKKYKVEVSNLVDENDIPTILTYTVTFFSYGLGDGYSGDYYWGERPKSLNSKYTSLKSNTFTYTGKRIVPSVTVKYSGRTLIKNANYSVSCTNNTKIGTGTITIKGKKPFSGTIKKTFKIVPGKVTSLKKVRTTSTSISLSWKKVKGASGYEIWRATSKSGKYSKIKTRTANTYSNSSLKKHKCYYYKVRAYKTVSGKKIYGSYSSALSAKTK